LRKILIISLCRYKLSEEEFVRPIRRLAEETGYVVEVSNYMEGAPVGVRRVIVSGTALRDREYLKHIRRFGWIGEFNGKVFGIGAGALAISSALGCRLVDRKLIGVYEVKALGGRWRAYFLIDKSPVLDERFEVLGWVDDSPAYFQLRGTEIYGSLFHPEVLNRDILVSFLRDG